MLEFVIGVPGSGKTNYIMQCIARDVQQGQPAVLITTRQATHAMERRLVRDHLPQGLLSVQVLDMDRLAQSILEEAGGFAGEHLSALGRMMAVRAVAAQCKDDLRIYSQALSQEGFSGRISAQLENLWRWKISPESLITAAQSVENRQLQDKLHDIAMIQNACQAYFAAHDCAPMDAMQLAAEKVQDVDWIGHTTFYVDGLEAEDAASRALLGKIMAICPNMHLTVCMDASHAQQARFDSARAAMALYRDLAKDMGVETKEHHLTAKENRHGALCHLRDQLFVYPGRAWNDDADGRVVLVTNRDPRSEAQYVAAQIIDHCRRENLRYRDITVLCAGGKEGYAQLRRAFDDFGIPAFYDVRRDLNDNACAALVVQLVQACMGAWRTQSILPILKSGLTCFDLEEVCLAENYILQRGISGAARWKRPWRGKDSEKAEELRQKVVKLLDPFFSAMTGNVSCSARVEALFEVLDRLEVCENLEQSVLQLQADGFSQEAAVSAQVWKVICEVLGQIQHVMGREVFTLSDFCATLQEGLLATQLGIIPTTLDQVMVSDPTRWNTQGAKVLFLIGATDEALSVSSDTNALFDDDDVLTLMQQADLTIAADPSLRASQFKMQLYRALCAAQDKIIISRPVMDMSAQPTSEAQLVSHLKRLFPKAQVRSGESIPVCAREGFSKWARGMRRAAEGFDVPLWLGAAGAWFDQNEEWEKKARSVRQILQREAEQSIDPMLAKKLFSPLRMSVTQLEKYAKCPFAHFAQYALGARVRQEFSEGGRADTGSLVHDMMYLLGKDILDGKVNVHDFDAMLWSRQAFDRLEHEREDNVQAYYESLSGSASGKAIQDRLLENVVFAANNLVRSIAQSKFEIAAVEQELPPTYLDTTAGQVELTGRIDRVDVAHLAEFDAARVIDYKSSAKNTALSQIYYGQQMQLAAYLLSVCENAPLFESLDLAPGGMLYFPIGDRNTVQEDESRMHGIVNLDEEIMLAMDTETENGKSHVVAPVSRGTRSGRLTSAQMNLVLQFARDELTGYADSAAQGDARACPSWTATVQNRACTYCDYAGACGFDVRQRPLDVRRMPNLKDEDVLKTMAKEDGADEQNP